MGYSTKIGVLPYMTLTALTSENPSTITRLHTMNKQKPPMDDHEDNSNSENLSMSNAITIEQPDALSQLIRFGKVDESISPVDEKSDAFDLEQSSLTTKSLGGSAVFVDRVIEEPEAIESTDLSDIGNNIDYDAGDAKPADQIENYTPPDVTLSTKLENGDPIGNDDISNNSDKECRPELASNEKQVSQPGGSLMDKLRVSEVFNAAKTRGAEEPNRPTLEFARHISGDQLQNILKSVNTKELLESSDNDSIKETLMQIQQAALEEVQEQEDQKGVVDEMLEAIATSSGVTELAGAISEQLRSQEVIEEAAERECVEADSPMFSEENIQPEQLKEPEEPIIHVDVSACTSRTSFPDTSEKGTIAESDSNSDNELIELFPSALAKPMLDYDEYWREYGLQFTILLSIALLALIINVLGF